MGFVVEDLQRGFFTKAQTITTNQSIGLIHSLFWWDNEIPSKSSKDMLNLHSLQSFFGKIGTSRLRLHSDIFKVSSSSSISSRQKHIPHSLKLTNRTWKFKMESWKTKFSFLLGQFRPIFRGELAVSFRECQPSFNEVAMSEGLDVGGDLWHVQPGEAHPWWGEGTPSHWKGVATQGKVSTVWFGFFWRGVYIVM